MTAWPDRLEHFLDHYPHIIAAVEAISTFGAVVVALWVSRRASTTRLTAYITQQFVMQPSMTERPEYLVAVLTNTGVMTCYISLSFLLWTRPYRRKSGWMLTFPLDYYATDKHIAQRTYPVELKPKASEQLTISDMPTFRMVMRQCIAEQSNFGKAMFRFVRVTIQTVDGHFFRAKISKEIRREIWQIIRKVRKPSAQPF